MSYLSKRRKAWGYESSVPRCSICKNFQKPRYVLINSLPKWSEPVCRKGEFTVKSHGCCDRWEGLDGSTLQKERKA